MTPPLPSNSDDLELNNIEKYGCHIWSVFDPNDVEPEFSYSAGFTKTVQQGEVIIFGLRSDVRVYMINETLRQCRHDLKLKDGCSISGLIEGFDVIARAIPEKNITPEFFGTAIWYSRHEFESELHTAYQLVWPGALDGLYPWEEGCDPEVIVQQPALYQREASQ